MRRGGDFEKRITPNCVHFPTAVSATDSQKKHDRRPRANHRILQFPQAPVQGDQRTIKSTTRECSNLVQPVWFFRMGFEEVAKRSPTANAVFNQRWEFTSNSGTKNTHKFARKEHAPLSRGDADSHDTSSLAQYLDTMCCSCDWKFAWTEFATWARTSHGFKGNFERTLGKGSSCGMTFI